MENITNLKIMDFLNEHFSSVNKVLIEFRKECEREYIPIIQRDTEELLRFLISLQKPAKILEVGTCLGYSASVMALTCSRSKTTTIERNVELVEEAQYNLDRLGVLKRVKVLLGDAQVILKKLMNSGEIFDFAFVDGGKSHYIEFCESVIEMMSEGGIILCDNILQRGMTVDECYDPKGKHKKAKKKMNEFIEWIEEDERVETIILPVGDGVLLAKVGNKV